MTILVVWIIYAYLHAFRLDWLGWFYSKLLPLTNGLYALVETYFPSDVKYKVRGAITDDLGQRSIFLLLLTATVELTLYSLFKLLKALVRRLEAAPRRGVAPLAARSRCQAAAGRRRRGCGQRIWPGRASRRRAAPACRHRRPG